MVIYLAGPMRGKPNLNFAAFDEAAEKLRAQGNTVVSPADLDREAGTPQDESKLTQEIVAGCLKRDFQRLTHCEAIAMLPGWEQSEFAPLEKRVAEACGMPIYGYDHGELFPLDQLDVLSEARGLVCGQRRRHYGHPLADYTRTAALWSAILGHEITPREAILCMVAVKLSRETHCPRRDNRVDMAGYAMCLDLLEEPWNE